MKRSLLLCVLMVTGSLLWEAPASAEDVQLLPPSLMAPSSKDTVPAGKFKKDPPWTIGMSWPGVATHESYKPFKR
jgi:ribose transport system substrate-binding protein